MKVLLFFLYGSVGRECHLELSYSILSAQKFLQGDTADIKVIFASDRRNLRPDLPAEQLLIEDQVIHEWQLGGAFGHAAKQHVLAYALDLFDASIILMDYDTVFLEQRYPCHSTICAIDVQIYFLTGATVNRCHLGLAFLF